MSTVKGRYGTRCVLTKVAFGLRQHVCREHAADPVKDRRREQVLHPTSRRVGDAAKVARRLEGELREPPTTVYSSVLPRAAATAAIVAAVLRRPNVVRDCGLCTWHTPTHADGKLWSEYRRESSLAGDGVYRPFEQGNESWSELVGRTGRALEQIAARHARETVVVVAHAETIQSSLIVFGGLPLALGFDMSIANTSITEWVTAGDPEAWPRPRWILVRLNDSAHLARESGPNDPASTSAVDSHPSSDPTAAASERVDRSIPTA